MRRQRIWIFALVGVSPISCYDNDPVDAMTATATDAADTETPPNPLTTSGVDDTTSGVADGPTDSSPSTTTTTTDGCEAGVFGQSQFGAACFQ